MWALIAYRATSDIVVKIIGLSLLICRAVAVLND